MKKKLLQYFVFIALSSILFFPATHLVRGFILPTCNPPNCTGSLKGLSTGNISIGTTNPEGLFQIASSTASNVKLVIERADVYKSAVLRFNTGTGTDWTAGLLNGGGTISNGWGISKTNFVSDAKFILTDGTFNVGIGTTNPAYKLDVVGDINFTGTLRQNGTAFSGSQWTTSGSNLYFSAGAVAIGLTSPDTNYKVTTTAGGVKAENSDASNPAGYFSNGSTGPSLVTGTGNVGIGTTNPVAKLDIKGGGVNIGATGDDRYLTLFGSMRWMTGSPTGLWDAKMLGESLAFNYYTGTSWLTNILLLTSAGISSTGSLTISGAGNSSIAGNVGIGTIAPGEKLEVSATAPVIKLDANTGTAAGTDLGSIVFNNRGVYGSNTHKAIAIRAIGADIYGRADLAFGVSYADGATYPSEVMRLQSATGNVGIGTTAPSTNLHVAGIPLGTTGKIRLQAYSASYYTDITHDASGSTETVGTIINTVGTAPTAFNIQENGTSRLYIKAGGNVGIGTTAPDEKLTVNGAIRTTTNAVSWNTQLSGLIDYYGNNMRIVATAPTATSNGIAFFTTNSGTTGQAMQILPSGNVGIGTTAPGNLLTVNGTIQGSTLYATSQLAASSVTADYLSGGANLNLYAGGTSGYMTFSTAGEKMRITSGGNVGIGTTDPGAHKLSVVGTAGLSTGTAWTSTSDQRWKNVYSELKGESLNKIMALRPISYKWNALHDSQFGENPGLKYGFIAQEVKNVIPEMISRDARGYYWYNPTGMEAILTGAIQEQQKQIEELKAEIFELKERIK